MSVNDVNQAPYRITIPSVLPCTGYLRSELQRILYGAWFKTQNVPVNDFNQALYRITIHSVLPCTCHLQSVFLEDAARGTMDLAQLVARRSHNPKVVSSILTHRRLAHCLGRTLPKVHLASKQLAKQANTLHSCWEIFIAFSLNTQRAF